ncbi:uncharacterized protein L201_003359 [Kwoniella dendrophila CBS 6074]|uniref:BZIP domain-containing protein n=1 Tax=Kwoniella dendrophila CBS 6074 TaxID=1295534 RepID=A0AAX4JUG3_9TREE
MPNVLGDSGLPLRLSPPSTLKRRPTSPSSSHSSDQDHHSQRLSEPLSPENHYGSHQYVSNPPVLGSTASVRRREANRLAAQRFRSRKKGYQDSLEERIRILESEKEVLIRQLDESLSHSSRSTSSLQSRSSNVRNAHGNVDGADGHSWHTKPTPRNSTTSQRSNSPDRREPPCDNDVRIASLESANRRLQDDVRNLFDENEQLRDELRRWRSWNRDKVREDHARRAEVADGHHRASHQRSDMVDGDHKRRPDMVDGNQSHQQPESVDGHHPHRPELLDGYHSHRPDMADGDHTSHAQVDGDHTRSSLPQYERSAAFSTPSSSSSSFGSTSQTLPKFERSESFSRSTQLDGHPANIQLPPLRLPPIRTALSTNAPSTLPSPTHPGPLRGFSGPPLERPPQMDGHR